MDRSVAPSIPEGGSHKRDPISEDEYPVLPSEYDVSHDVKHSASSPPEYYSPASTSFPDSPPPRYYYDSDDESGASEPYSDRDSSKHCYTYTSIRSDQIRLILLSQGNDADPVHCAVKVIDVQRVINTRLKFQALSYAWGKGPPKECIYLQDLSVPSDGKSVDDMMLLMAQQTKPRPFAVRSNLYQALRQLRSNVKEIWLWVDAICINQKDDTEKNHQIPKMPDIYGNAWTVTIWIGGSDNADQAEDAMDFVPNIIDLKLLDRLTMQEWCDVKTLQSWVAFVRLLRRPWFSRRWVVQEVAFARRASIRCGSKIISWTDFADAIDLFTRKLEVIRSLYDASELSKFDPDALSHVEFTGSKAIVGASNTVLRKADNHQNMPLEDRRHIYVDRLMDLESLVMNFRSLDATDPRDAIYAFLSLANDSGTHIPASEETECRQVAPLVPQYNKKAVEVYADFVEYVVRRTSSLDIMCRHWALPLKPIKVEWSRKRKNHFQPPLPSWIGELKDSPFGRPSRFSGRINGDSLVGAPEHRIYNASGKTTPNVTFGEPKAEDVPELIYGDQGLKRPHSMAREPSFTRLEDGGIWAPTNKRAKLDKTSNRSTGITESVGQQAAESERNNDNGTKPQTSTRGQIPRVYTGTMTVEGIFLGRITCTSPRVVDGTISDDCFGILGWHRGDDDQDVKDQVWRTLVADRGPDGKNAPAWYKRACVYALRKTSAEGDLNTSKLIANKSLPESVTDYLKRVQSVIWSRKFFSCSRYEHGTVYKFVDGKSSFEHAGEYDRTPQYQLDALFGLGSKHIREDDLICILLGCSVPVVLRPSASPGADGYIPVSFVGECFVYGKMDGEVFADPTMSKIEEKTIRFKIS